MSSHEYDYKAHYKSLKRKLKVLIYENECFQEELRKAQKSLLDVQRDKSFLLDRLLQFQEGARASSSSEETENSDDDNDKEKKRRIKLYEYPNSLNVGPQIGSKNSAAKKRKLNSNTTMNLTKTSTFSQNSKVSASVVNENMSKNVLKTTTNKVPSKRARIYLKKGAAGSNPVPGQLGMAIGANAESSNSHMSREEIERQLAARQPVTDFSTTVSLTLPNQLFADNLLESNFIENDLETSPSNLGEDITFDNLD